MVKYKNKLGQRQPRMFNALDNKVKVNWGDSCNCLDRHHKEVKHWFYRNKVMELIKDHCLLECNVADVKVSFKMNRSDHIGASRELTCEVALLADNLNKTIGVSMVNGGCSEDVEGRGYNDGMLLLDTLYDEAIEFHYKVDDFFAEGDYKIDITVEFRDEYCLFNRMDYYFAIDLKGEKFDLLKHSWEKFKERYYD